MKTNPRFPPIDFSFCELESPEDLQYAEPRTGKQKKTKSPSKKNQNSKETSEEPNFIGTVVKLNNNPTLQNIEKLPQCLDSIIYDLSAISFIDLSFCQLRFIPKDFANLNLKMVYLHSNRISKTKDLHVLQQMPQLISLTLHGNPLEMMKNYKYHVIAHLPKLRSLDFATITRKDKDTARTYWEFYIEGPKRRELNQSRNST